MRIIAWSTLREFSEKHPEVAGALNAWYHLVKRTAFLTPHDVRDMFPDVSLLGDGIAVFNIRSCRLEVHMRYDLQIVFILSIDTHEEYDRRNKARKKK